MRWLWSRSARTAVAAFTAAFVVGVPPAARARANGWRPDFRVQIQDPWLAIVLRRALDGASSRLSDPGCAAVLGDFHDRDGRPLTAYLDLTGLDVDEYLRSIVFVAGETRARRCAVPSVMAVTSPGSRVVHVCRRFEGMARRDPTYAQVAMIHETLHTLGLGEDPPSSAQITAQVRARCDPASTGSNAPAAPERRVEAAEPGPPDPGAKTEVRHASRRRSVVH